MQLMPNNRWIEVDIDALVHNLEAVRSLLKENTRLIAVLKANAYGLGAVGTARVLARHGVDYFAVTFPEEAFELREGGINTDILVFAPAGEQEVEKAVEQGLTLTVASYRDYRLASEAASRLNETVRIHLKIDTGLGRFGVTADRALELARLIHYDQWLVLEGLYTHFAEAGARSPKFTQSQFEQLQKTVDALTSNGIRPALIHCCNSAAALRFPEMHLDAVRIGTLLGGQHPAGHVPNKIKLKNPYRFKARVTAVREMPAGSYLGYYRTYRTRAASKIAVVPVGFADGLGLEALSRPGSWFDLVKIIAKLVGSYLNLSRFTVKVKIGKDEYPVRGKVFMQFCLVELPPDFPVEPGTVVEVPVKRTLAPRDIRRAYIENGCLVEAEGDDEGVLGAKREVVE